MPMLLPRWLAGFALALVLPTRLGAAPAEDVELPPGEAGAMMVTGRLG